MNAPLEFAAYSIPQVMGKIGIGRDTLYKLIRQGNLPARKLGRRTVVLESDLQAFIEALPRLGGGAQKGAA